MVEWYAYEHDYNADKIVPFNIFEHGRFYEDCKKNARKNSKDFDSFCDQLRKDVMYYYWSKCEWELVLSPWTSQSEKAAIKIDVYDQIDLNWDIFCEYVWSHAAELRRREKKK